MVVFELPLVRYVVKLERYSKEDVVLSTVELDSGETLSAVKSLCNFLEKMDPEEVIDYYIVIKPVVDESILKGEEK